MLIYHRCLLYCVALFSLALAQEATGGEECTIASDGSNQCVVLATPPWNDMTLPSFKGEKGSVTCDLDPFSLREDLDAYPEISREDVDRAERLYGQHARRLVIKDNVLYGRTCHEKAIVGVLAFVEDMLVMLLQRVKVPDVDFVLNGSDYPQNKRSYPAEKDAPLLSMCASYNYRDIVVPTYTHSLNVVYGYRGIPNADPMPWEERKEQLVWRGSDSNRIRFKFNKIANQPQFEGLTDVGIHKMIRIPHDEEKHGPVKDSLPGSFPGYKWIANIDGSVAAYRMATLSATTAAIVMHESEYYEHWYRSLVPYEHFVPMAGDFSNLTQVLEWLQTHDEEAKEIGINMRKFAEEHLSTQDILCYWYTFLYEYASRMTYEPTVLDNMEKFKPTRTLPVRTRPWR